MAMDLNAKAAYIRGLMTGMEFDPNSKNGKIIAAMMDLLEEMASTVTEHDEALDQVYEDVDTLDEDLTDLVNFVFDVDEEDDEDAGDEDAGDEDAAYEVTCPNCGAVSTVGEDELLNNELVCPNCGASFDIELSEDDEDEEAATAPEAPADGEIPIE